VCVSSGDRGTASSLSTNNSAYHDAPVARLELGAQTTSPSIGGVQSGVAQPARKQHGAIVEVDAPGHRQRKRQRARSAHPSGDITPSFESQRAVGPPLTDGTTRIDDPVRARHREARRQRTKRACPPIRCQPDRESRLPRRDCDPLSVGTEPRAAAQDCGRPTPGCGTPPGHALAQPKPALAPLPADSAGRPVPGRDVHPPRGRTGHDARSGQLQRE
jgi:hypothetical protein